MATETFFSPVAKKIIMYLQAHVGSDVDFHEIAAAIEEEPRRTNCTITSALVRKGYAERLDVDGRKVVRLTDAGKTVNLNQGDDA